MIHKKILELQKREAGGYVTSSFMHLGKQLDYRVKVEGDRMIRGYLAVFNKADDKGTTPIKGAFAKSLRERGVGSLAKQKILFLWFHDLRDPIGQFTELEEDDYGLRFAASIDEIPQGDRALKQVNSGTLNQFSYGFLYVWDKMEYDEAADVVVMREVDLWEGSVVSYGSQADTFAIRSKDDLANYQEELNAEMEEFVKTLSRPKQMELRQMITRYKALSEVKPDQWNPLKVVEPLVLSVGDYKLDVKQFKN
jgi:HK97 family phage prohead protease